MLTKRIIACLDVKDGRTVKGINFENITDVGDPAELAVYYSEQGADELVFLDITATHENRKTQRSWVKEVARNINIPFTVGGGISSADDVYELLNVGADKVSINSAAVKNPALITELAARFGSQCIVLAVDTLRTGNEWNVYINGGRSITSLSATTWIKEGVERGAGEILLTSIGNDGTKKGFAVDITRMISEMVNVPVIASGGAGNAAHFHEVFTSGKADAALAAGIFHRKELEIPLLKKYLQQNNIAIRI